MISSYKKLGDYIQLVDDRNKDLEVKNLVGLTINKIFIPSVANIIGTDMSNYKIIRKNQFACSTMQVRRDKKMPLALYKNDEPAIISQAYPIFEIIDAKELLPEYLMMWFTRAEFDREACFHAVGGVRGSLEWDDFLDFKLPIPSLEKQQEIVNEYHTIQKRINLNYQLINKLEETAQTIYKQWFVDFEFPDEYGKPYKSNGGKMVWCEELEKEIPEGWNINTIEDYCKIFTGNKDVNETVLDGKYTFFSCSPDTYLSNDYLYDGKVVLIAGNGSYTGRVNYFEGKFDLYQRTYAIVSENDFLGFIYYLLKIEFEDVYLGGSRGSSIPYIVKGDISNFKIKYNLEIVEKFQKIAELFLKNKEKCLNETQKLEELKELLLAKMTRVEN